MSVGLQNMPLTVAHKIPGDGYFDDDTVEYTTLTCLVERVTSAENMSMGVAPSSNLIVQLHVVEPEAPCVVAGDTFVWHGTMYTVTAVDGGLQEENVVPMMPYRWAARAEANR